MFDRRNLALALAQRSFGREATCAVLVTMGGHPIIMTGECEPGGDLLVLMDKAEKFLRLVNEGLGFEDAYCAAFPA